MQYPFRVVFGDRQTYVVRANDSRQAVRRAMREHREDTGREPEGRIRVRSLTPKEADDQYYPRIGGSIIGTPCATWEEAVNISVQESLKTMTKGET